MLDQLTLKLVLTVVTATLCVLFWDSFLKRRSAYSGWWCVALGAWLAAGNAVYLLKGTVWSGLAAPLGDALMVAGAFSMWGAFRSLRFARARRWAVWVAALMAAVGSAAERPGDGLWTVGLVYLGLMSAGMALAVRELVLLDAAGSTAHRPVLAAAAVMVVYFVSRTVVYVVAGPASELFVTFFGPSVTCLLLLVLLLLVSFSMKALNNDNMASTWRELASRDGMTGLLNRGTFNHQAVEELSRTADAGGQAVLILADLDHFKSVNDTHGHSAGDAVIKAFAAASVASVRRADLVGRYGGEEFILLLPGTTIDRALAVTGDISRRLADAVMAHGNPPTASYGIASTAEHGPDLEALTLAADDALYRAKAAGRNQAVTAPPAKAPGAEHN
ncbi:GGDEF domain-containing protein [Paenarthrobacter sp. NPDC090522]|uniref:sensor domain-containing diguanylate cyclase n=1 Tax=Paenarthrobacter sp. NPDC090522 TaxID=3364383 RepID=UPI003825D5AA